MIYEYALEPRTVAVWASDPESFDRIVDEIGVGTHRIPAEVPLAAFRKEARRQLAFVNTGRDALAATRLEEILKKFDRVGVPGRRDPAGWSGDSDWLEYVELEHGRSPFRLVVSEENPRNREYVATRKDLWRRTEWRRREGLVARVASEYGRTLEPLLRMASVVCLVDPYFDPTHERYRKTILELMRRSGAAVRVFALLVKEAPKQPSLEERRRVFQDKLGWDMQSPGRLIVLPIAERQGREKVHNRYVLTDVGGVSFGVGLDESDDAVALACQCGVSECKGQHDEVSVLDSMQWAARWRQYVETLFAVIDREGNLRERSESAQRCERTEFEVTRDRVLLISSDDSPTRGSRTSGLKR